MSNQQQRIISSSHLLSFYYSNIVVSEKRFLALFSFCSTFLVQNEYSHLFTLSTGDRFLWVMATILIGNRQEYDLFSDLYFLCCVISGQKFWILFVWYLKLEASCCSNVDYRNLDQSLDYMGPWSESQSDSYLYSVTIYKGWVAPSEKYKFQTFNSMTTLWTT